MKTTTVRVSMPWQLVALIAAEVFRVGGAHPQGLVPGNITAYEFTDDQNRGWSIANVPVDGGRGYAFRVTMVENAFQGDRKTHVFLLSPDFSAGLVADIEVLGDGKDVPIRVESEKRRPRKNNQQDVELTVVGEAEGEAGGHGAAKGV